MIYSKEQTEQSDFILKALLDEHGRMEYSDLAHLLNDHYNYDDAPFHQLEQLINVDGLVIRTENYVMLTQEGRKAAKSGIGKCLTLQEFLDRIKENKDIVGMAAGIGTVIGMAITVLTQCT